MAAESDARIQSIAMRMIAHEDSAFREFGQVFGQRLTGYFFRRGLSLADAEDLAATCVTDFALRTNQYNSQLGRFEAWVFTLARHAAADWHKSQKLHLSTDLLDESMERSLWTSGTETPETTAISDAVVDALNDLPNLDKRIVEMRDLGGSYAYSEIANALGISVTSARVRHCRALKRLEKILGQDSRIRDRIRKPEGLSHDIPVEVR